jgi:hypothetical protein
MIACYHCRKDLSRECLGEARLTTYSGHVYALFTCSCGAQNFFLINRMFCQECRDHFDVDIGKVTSKVSRRDPARFFVQQLCPECHANCTTSASEKVGLPPWDSSTTARS